MTDEKYMTEADLLQLLKTVALELEIILEEREEISVAELLERYKGLIEKLSRRMQEGRK